jgi:hypothetical protein
MSFMQRFINIEDNLIAAVIYGIMGGSFYVVYTSFQSAYGESMWIKIVTGLACAVLLALAIVIRKKLLWACRKTRNSIGKLKKCLHSLPPGLRPAVAQMSTETANNLCKGTHGENITLTQYMTLISAVCEYHNVVDVTYIAVTAPSTWGKKEDIPNFKQNADQALQERGLLLEHLWDKYFDSQKTQKAANPTRIRMRRLFLFKGQCPEGEKESIDYLTTQHATARIGLLAVDKNIIPSKCQRDLVLILCSDKRMWIIESDYAPSKFTVNTRVIYKVDSFSDIKALFQIIQYIYNCPEGRDSRLLVPDSGNAPDISLLRACGISIGE